MSRPATDNGIQAVEYSPRSVQRALAARADGARIVAGVSRCRPGRPRPSRARLLAGLFVVATWSAAGTAVGATPADPVAGPAPDPAVDSVADPVADAESALAFRTDRAPVALVLDSIGAMLGLDVVLEGEPQALFSGEIRGSLVDALTGLQTVEPLLFDVHEGTLDVLPGSAATTERLANDVAAILPISAVLALGSPLPSNRIQSDTSGTLISGHPAFVTRAARGLRALLAMRGLAIADPQAPERSGSTATLDGRQELLDGLVSIPGFNTL